MIPPQREAFKQWLESKSPEEVPGSATVCPIAAYLCDHLGVPSPTVGVSRYTITVGPAYTNHEEWGICFVAEIDKRTPQPLGGIGWPGWAHISAATCLEVLAGC